VSNRRSGLFRRSRTHCHRRRTTRIFRHASGLNQWRRLCICATGHRRSQTRTTPSQYLWHETGRRTCTYLRMRSEGYITQETLGKLDDRGAMGMKAFVASGSHILGLGRAGTSPYMKASLPYCLTMDPSRRSDEKGSKATEIDTQPPSHTGDPTRDNTESVSNSDDGESAPLPDTFRVPGSYPQTLSVADRRPR